MRLVELGPSFNGPKNIKGKCTLQDLNRVPQVRGGEREGLSQAWGEERPKPGYAEHREDTQCSFRG